MKYEASDGSTWRVNNESPPIPIRALDWEWVSEDYDGPGDDRHGNEATEADAIAAIETYVSERDDEENPRCGYCGHLAVTVTPKGDRCDQCAEENH